MSGYLQSIYCLQEESRHFGLRALTNFVLGVSKHFGHKKSHRKNQQHSQTFLNYTKSSYIHFCPNR